MNKIGTCGFNRKNDVRVTVDLNVSEVKITIVSKLKAAFGSAMEASVYQVLLEEGISFAHVTLEDDGALDYAIRARTRTALRRAINHE